MTDGLRREAYSQPSAAARIPTSRFALRTRSRQGIYAAVLVASLFGCGGTSDAFRAQLAECDQGSAEACRVVGWGYEKGDGVSQDHDAACQHLVRACDGADGRSCYDLAGLCSVGSEQTAGVDQGRLIQRACDLGYELACTQANILSSQDQPL